MDITNGTQKLQQLITLFLQLNDEPADEQIHNLAHALGCDKETLEAIVYRMLAVVQRDKPVVAAVDSTDVLEGLVDEQQIPLDQITMNDGLLDDPEDTFGDSLYEETKDDGAAVEDTGIDVDYADDLLNDGVALPQGF